MEYLPEERRKVLKKIAKFSPAYASTSLSMTGKLTLLESRENQIISMTLIYQKDYEVILTRIKNQSLWI